MHELTPLLLEASKLLIVGMGFVFVFLALLTLVIRVLGKLVSTAPITTGTKKYATKRHIGTTNNQNKLNPSVVAAISAAVTQYRTQADKTCK